MPVWAINIIASKSELSSCARFALFFGLFFARINEAAHGRDVISKMCFEKKKFFTPYPSYKMSSKMTKFFAIITHNLFIKVPLLPSTGISIHLLIFSLCRVTRTIRIVIKFLSRASRKCCNSSISIVYRSFVSSIATTTWSNLGGKVLIILSTTCWYEMLSQQDPIAWTCVLEFFQNNLMWFHYLS